MCSFPVQSKTLLSTLPISHVSGGFGAERWEQVLATCVISFGDLSSRLTQVFTCIGGSSVILSQKGEGSNKNLIVDYKALSQCKVWDMILIVAIHNQVY